MPRGDGTGPMGQGPMTGRGLGYCAGYPHPGFGRGRGFRRRFYRYPIPVEPIRLTKQEQKKILEEEKKQLELELKAIQEKLKELK